MSNDGWGNDYVAAPPATGGRFPSSGFGGTRGFGSVSAPAPPQNTMQQPATSRFGQQPSGFHTSNAAPPSTGFGQQSSVFATSNAAPSSTGFGQQPAFGATSRAPASTGFGQQSSVFATSNAAPSSTGFGQQSAFSATNATATSSKGFSGSFGTEPGNQNIQSFNKGNTGSFGGGQPAQFGFGGQNTKIPMFGASSEPAAPTANSGFGTSNNGFGGQSGSTQAKPTGGFGSGGSAFPSSTGGFGSGGSAFPSSTGGFGSGTGGFSRHTMKSDGAPNFGASSGFGGIPNFGAGSGGGGCFNCGEGGHNSRDCTKPRKPRDPPADPCPICQQTGHWKADCPQAKCFNCRKEGHKQENCPEPQRPCFNCGVHGHNSTECPEPRKPSTCRNCGLEGHRSFECPDPQKPREDGSKPPSTYIPEEAGEETLFSSGIHKGTMFDRFFTAETAITTAGGSIGQVQKCDDFGQLGFGAKIMENLRRCDYTLPTPVQQLSIPIIMDGRDLVACAQTGSGKTAAYLLPAIRKLFEWEDFNNSGEGCSPRILVIVPTRELAVQVYQESRKYAFGTVLSCKAVYGGTSVHHQKNELLKGATIVAATLGRLKQFVEEGVIKLDKLRFFVLDEVDRLMEQDSAQLINLINQKITSPNVQRVMFSATFPTEVQCQVASIIKPDYIMVTVDKLGTANACITQEIVYCDQKEKQGELMKLLDIGKNLVMDPASKIYTKKTLIFVSKKSFADTLGSILCLAGLPATTLHSDRMQNERSEAMKDFMYGTKAVMVATAVMERGLDIRGVDLVVNYDLPDEIDQYIHRIGRTGRVGNPGRAVSIMTERDTKLAPALVQCLLQSGQVVQDWLANLASGAPPTPATVSAPAETEEW